MLYAFSKQDKLLPLSTILGLEIKQVNDPLQLSIKGEISLQEVTCRLANENKAYVAFLYGIPAAFGWMAMDKARIGELNHEFTLPVGHRYLWNFSTLFSFRGLGIYPRLLQSILSSEGQTSDWFWIMHAPENKVSKQGIRKAGFQFIGNISLINGKGIIIDPKESTHTSLEIEHTFGFTHSEEGGANWWNCTSPYLKNRNPQCCCLEDNIACTPGWF
ncbi:hypothetical protein Q0590_33700 [Rhodocytophaga aerolata]|uniref:N-acetyltransferase domain-containing protein n=1 Tax=Rhodocytophaga aerolata TaxID=455078 RepID=A0ABT8RGP9_9BACT|nr:hypothetical protein [Rhodocytophaga aerolata]MDO1451278.1 hypothetical protein [Rhodocytophaga aerolata]